MCIRDRHDKHMGSHRALELDARGVGRALMSSEFWERGLVITRFFLSPGGEGGIVETWCGQGAESTVLRTCLLRNGESIEPFTQLPLSAPRGDLRVHGSNPHIHCLTRTPNIPRHSHTRTRERTCSSECSLMLVSAMVLSLKHI